MQVSTAIPGVTITLKWFTLINFPEPIVPLLPVFTVVLASEMLVDWIKHAFITKFNDISPDVYRRYRAILAKDLVTSRHGNVSISVYMVVINLHVTCMQAKADHCDLVSRRMGFISLPLGCLVGIVLIHGMLYIV